MDVGAEKRIRNTSGKIACVFPCILFVTLEQLH